MRKTLMVLFSVFLLIAVSSGVASAKVYRNEAPRSRAARYQRGLKTILYWKGKRRFPFQTNPFLVFYPAAELRGILLIKWAAQTPRIAMFTYVATLARYVNYE